MIHIHPFRGWRPPAELISKTACMPYDVIDSQEARDHIKDSNNAFLHVIRPEIDLPEDVSIYDDRVYEKGRENLAALKSNGSLIQDETPSLYIYQLEENGKTQTGLFSCVSVKDYDQERILKHELTRPDKENDRTRHILTMQAHAEPVMLTCKDNDDLESILKAETHHTPAITHTAPDGVIHRIWTAEKKDELIDVFKKISNLYVADGHHRCKSASRVAEELRGDSDYSDAEYEFFPAVIFPMGEMNILPYNRIVYKITDANFSEICSELDVKPSTYKEPKQPGEICLYFNRDWYSLTLPDSENDSIASQLDVARLQEFILEPFLNITDVRTDKNIHFVGGIRGTKELERLVDSGKAELGISMYPTSIQELVDVSDAGELMPPKSTWFEPKLSSGLLVHTF